MSRKSFLALALSGLLIFPLSCSITKPGKEYVLRTNMQAFPIDPTGRIAVITNITRHSLVIDTNKPKTNLVVTNIVFSFPLTPYTKLGNTNYGSQYMQVRSNFLQSSTTGLSNWITFLWLSAPDESNQVYKLTNTTFRLTPKLFYRSGYLIETFRQ